MPVPSPPAPRPRVATPRWLRFVRAATALPLAWLVWLAFTDGLGANPIERLIRETGSWALIWLCASLAVTPVRKAGGWTALAPLRRTFGLTGFSYASLHFLAYAAWDQGFVLADIVADVAKRPFIAVGMASLAGLSVLAATSPRAVVKRLGAVRWKRLHRLAYVVPVLVLLHFTWHKAGKQDFERPIAYAIVVAALLGARLLPGRPTRRDGGRRPG